MVDDDPDGSPATGGEPAEAARTDDSDPDDSEWRYSVVGEGDEGPTVGLATTGSADGPNESGGEGVAGPFAPAVPVEPGTPALENTLFVAAGVYLMALVIASAVAPLDATAAFGLAAVVAVAAAGLYGFFRRF